MRDVCSQPSMGSLGLNAGVVWVLVRDGLESEKTNKTTTLTFSACVASGKTLSLPVSLAVQWYPSISRVVSGIRPVPYNLCTINCDRKKPSFCLQIAVCDFGQICHLLSVSATDRPPGPQNAGLCEPARLSPSAPCTDLVDKALTKVLMQPPLGRLAAHDYTSPYSIFMTLARSKNFPHEMFV